MDTHTIASRRPRLAVYLWTCGLALGLGWAVRGLFIAPMPGRQHNLLLDGPAGVLAAAWAGALGAAAIALASPHSLRKGRAVAMALAGAVGAGAGGVLVYGGVLPFLDRPDTLVRGLALLTAKGAVWGALAGVPLGIALSPLRYRRREWLWLIPAAAWLAFARYGTPDPAGYDDMSKSLALLALAAVAWLYGWKRDRAATFFALASAAGFAFAGPLYGFLRPERGLLADAAWGLCGGLAWGVAAYVLDEDHALPGPYRSRVGWMSCATAGLTALAAAHAIRAAQAPAPGLAGAFTTGALLFAAALLALSLWREARPGPKAPAHDATRLVAALAVGGVAVHLLALRHLHGHAPHIEEAAPVIAAAGLLAVQALASGRRGRGKGRLGSL